MTHAHFGRPAPIDWNTQGPHTFSIADADGRHSCFNKLPGADIPVWKCDDVAMTGMPSTIKLYLFQMLGSLFIVLTDLDMTCPQEVQTASHDDQLGLLYCSWTGDENLEPGWHDWDRWNASENLWEEGKDRFQTIILDNIFWL